MSREKTFAKLSSLVPVPRHIWQPRACRLAIAFYQIKSQFNASAELRRAVSGLSNVVRIQTVEVKNSSPEQDSGFCPKRKALALNRRSYSFGRTCGMHLSGRPAMRVQQLAA